MSSNATSPKALFSSPTSSPTSLLFSQFASQYSKNLVPHYSRSVVQRIPLYLTSLAVPESSALCLSSSRLVCYRLNIPSLPLLLSCSLSSTLPRIRSSLYTLHTLYIAYSTPPPIH